MSSSKMFSQLKLITFDAKDTIIELTKNPGEHYADIARRHGFQVNDQEEQGLANSFKTAFSNANKHHVCFGRDTGLSLIDWWTLVVTQTFRGANFSQDRIPVKDMNEIALQAYNEYATSVCWRVKGDAIPSLEKIRSLRPDITMGVISNGDDRLDYLLDQLQLRPLLDFSIDSFTAQLEKPDKRIFDMAIGKSRLPITDPGSEAIHVGDDIKQDFEAARNAGWRALLLDTSNPSNGNPDQIVSLSQVINL